MALKNGMDHLMGLGINMGASYRKQQKNKPGVNHQQAPG